MSFKLYYYERINRSLRIHRYFLGGFGYTVVNFGFKIYHSVSKQGRLGYTVVNFEHLCMI